MGVDEMFDSESNREREGNAALGGLSAEELVRIGEAAIRERMEDIAKAAGLGSVNAVLAEFKDHLTDEDADAMNKRLNSGSEDAIAAFAGLIERIKGLDEADERDAVTERGGFVDHDSFVEACEKATAASDSGRPDRELEQRIGATPDHVIEGGGLGRIG